MLAVFCLSDGVLWVGSGEVAMVGDVQRAEGEERGVLGAFSFFSTTFHGSGQGRGGWARPRRLSRHGYRVRARENSGAHSETNFLRFLLTTCSIKCPQEFKFQIFENGHRGSSTYWTRVLELFLFGEISCFCRNHI
jgi:hypothetical protein